MKHLQKIASIFALNVQMTTNNQKVYFASEMNLSVMEVLKYTLTFIRLKLNSSKIQCAVAGRAWQRVNPASTWWELTSYNRVCISESSAAEFSSKYTNRHWISPSRNWQWNRKENPWQKRPGKQMCENTVTAQPHLLCWDLNQKKAESLGWTTSWEIKAYS